VFQQKLTVLSSVVGTELLIFRRGIQNDDQKIVIDCTLRTSEGNLLLIAKTPR
jgi:hypothetical protein